MLISNKKAKANKGGTVYILQSQTPAISTYRQFQASLQTKFCAFFFANWQLISV